jgi:precorrin-2 dehydrogenase / sirohydrochlorin ferrochelatase
VTESPTYYAAFLNLRNRLCVVVGGGKVAERKIKKLLDCGACVRVISPEVRSQVQQWAEEGQVEWVRRPYAPGDVSDAWLVFAATNDRQVNRVVWEEAEHAGKLVNVVDHPASCTLTVPASTRLGALQVAISTSGTDPAAAARLRQILEQDLEHGTSRFQQEMLNFLARDENTTSIP